MALEKACWAKEHVETYELGMSGQVTIAGDNVGKEVVDLLQPYFLAAIMHYEGHHSDSASLISCPPPGAIVEWPSPVDKTL